MDKRKSGERIKKKLFLTHLLVFLIINLEGGGLYKLSFSFYGKAEGRLLKIVKYRAYAETSAELLLKEKLSGTKKIFKLKKFLSPGYYMQTIEFSAEEIHIRVSGDNIKTAYEFGKIKLKTWCSKYKKLCSSIPEEKRKSLPFLYVGKPEFEFHMKQNKILLDTIKNRIYQKYAWPSKTIFPQPSYSLLEGALCFLNEGIPQNGEKSIEVDLTNCFKRIVKRAPKTIRIFVKPRQKKKIILKFNVKKDKKRTIYISKNRSNTKLWKSYRIKELKREIIFNDKKEITKNFFSIKVCSGKNCGEGKICLNYLL